MLVVEVHTRTNEVILGTTEGFARYDLDARVFEPHPCNPIHVPTEGGRIEPRMNDGKCDPFGRLWCGSLVRDLQNNDLVDGAANLWVLESGWSKDQPPVKVRAGVTCSNGIAWHGNTMYYTDSPTFCIEAFAFDSEQRADSVADSMAETRKHGCIRVSNSYPPVPDGCVVDSHGFVWSAMFGAGCVRRYDPSSGECVAEIRLPEEAGMQCTAVAWGGPELDDLYLTSAHEFWTEEEKARHPLAGKLFVASGTEIAELCGGGAVKGVAQNAYAIM